MMKVALAHTVFTSCSAIYKIRWGVIQSEWLSMRCCFCSSYSKLHLPSIQLLLVDPLCDLSDSQLLGSSSPTHTWRLLAIISFYSSFKKILYIYIYIWSSSMEYPLVKNIKCNKQDDICFCTIIGNRIYCSLPPICHCLPISKTQYQNQYFHLWRQVLSL